MICTHCNNEMRDGLMFCPVCGNRVAQKAGKKKSGVKETGEKSTRSWWLFAAIIVLAVTAFGGYSFFTSYYTGKMRETGENALKRKDYKTCVSSLEFVVRKNPKGSTRERMQLAECYLGIGETRTAVGQMKDAVAWAPKDPLAGAGLAKLFFLTKHYKEAEKQSLKTLRLTPGSQQAKQYLGMSQLQLEKYKKAEKVLLAARAGATTEDAILVNNSLGEARINLEDMKGAIEAYETSIALYANQLDVLINLAILYQKEEGFTQCLSCAKRAFEIAKQTGATAKKKKARTLADGCGAVVQLVGIKDCVAKRRELDREYVVIFSDLKLLMEEINTDPTDYIGKPNAELAYMLQQVTALQTRYRSISCPTDAENYFRMSVATFAAQLETLKQAVTGLKEYIETRDNQQLEKFQQMQSRLSRNNNEIINIWKTEEEKFDVPPIFKSGNR